MVGVLLSDRLENLSGYNLIVTGYNPIVTGCNPIVTGCNLIVIPHCQFIDVLFHSTVTDFARFLGWSTSSPRRAAI